MADTIAGHTFAIGDDGKERCACGKEWVDVAPATKADIGKQGWAHQGTLTENELAQIDAERERRWRLGMGISSIVKAA